MNNNTDVPPAINQPTVGWIKANERLLTCIAMMVLAIVQPFVMTTLLGPGDPNAFVTKAIPVAGDILAITCLIASLLIAWVTDTVTARVYLGVVGAICNFTVIFLAVRAFIH